MRNVSTCVLALQIRTGVAPLPTTVSLVQSLDAAGAGEKQVRTARVAVVADASSSDAHSGFELLTSGVSVGDTANRDVLVLIEAGPSALDAAQGYRYLKLAVDGGADLTLSALCLTVPYQTSFQPLVETSEPAEPPVNTGLPAVSGTPTVGETLTANPGTWTGTAPITFGYQWQRGPSASGPWTDIPGANASTYTQVAADDGQYLRSGVTGSNVAGSATAYSASVGPVSPASTGPVVGAVVEADGWTLAVTYTAAAPSTRADFALFAGAQSEANARVIATVSGPGFNRVGTAAVGATRSRQIVCHEVRQARYPDWEPGQPTSLQPLFAGTSHPLYLPSNRPLGEVDNGDGTRTIRLMLHKPVAPGETVSVLFKAGWRPAITADQTITATNSSTEALEIPSARWATVPYEAIRGTPTEPANSTIIDVLAAHILPEGKSGVAGVRIIATDGTNRSVASWLSIGTSTRYGDSLRCWTGDVSFEVDGSPGTYLNAGLIALHWTVYPWFGAPRHSSGTLDPATAAPSALHPGSASGNESMRAEAERALMLAYDRTGTRYGYTTQANPGGGTNPLGHAASTYYRYACVVVDPDGGRTTNPANRNEAERIVGLGNTPAEARANALSLPVADRCANQVVAGAALTRLGRSLDNANGYTATKTNAHDGCEMYFVAGTHDWSTATPLSGATSTETHLVWNGAGVASTSIRGAASGTHNNGGATRVRYRNCRFRMRSSGFPTGGSTVFWFDNVELIDDDTATPATVFGVNPPPAGLTWHHATNVIEDYAGSASWQNLSGSALMVRSVSSPKGFGSPVVANCVRTGTGNPGVVGLAAPALASGGANACREDVIWWSVRCFNLANMSPFAFSAPTYTDTDGRVKCVRLNLVNVLFERSSTGSEQPAQSIGENNNPEVDVSGCIFEGVTIVGGRWNMLYNQPAPVDIGGSFSRFNTYRQNRIANCYFDRVYHKADMFFDTSTSSVRASLGEPSATRGYRGHLTQGWQVQFGFMFEGNVDGYRGTGTGTTGQSMSNRGLRTVERGPGVETSLPLPPAVRDWPQFEDDRCFYAAVTTGTGDYRPKAGSPLLGLATSAQIDVDAAGVLRTGSTWPAGALGGV